MVKKKFLVFLIFLAFQYYLLAMKWMYIFRYIFCIKIKYNY